MFPHVHDLDYWLTVRMQDLLEAVEILDNSILIPDRHAILLIIVVYISIQFTLMMKSTSNEDWRSFPKAVFRTILLLN